MISILMFYRVSTEHSGRIKARRAKSDRTFQTFFYFFLENMQTMKAKISRL